MGTDRPPRRIAAVAALLAAVALLVVLGGCGVKSTQGNVVKGKELFVQKCGACHTLRRAGTKGLTGPNLDQAFVESRESGFSTATIRGVVDKQILNPNMNGVMPAKLYTGQKAHDVASYVALVAGKRGQDTGALATAGQGGGGTNGKAIFIANGCKSCHTLSDAGATGTTGPDLNSLVSAAAKYSKQLKISPKKYVEDSIVDPDAFVVPGYPKGVMPSNFGKSLKPAQVKALVAYLLKVGNK